MSQASYFPKGIVFDLDGTIWTPEMYHLWGGGGAPFTRNAKGQVKDRKGTTIELYDGVLECLSESQRRDVILGIASKCDEPEWAAECLERFEAPHGATGASERFSEKFLVSEIYYASSKVTHLNEFIGKTGLKPEEILFLDNEKSNIHAVSRMGVVSAYTPNGLTRAAWAEALELFERMSREREAGAKHGR